MKAEDAYYFSPVGWLLISADDNGIKSIGFSTEAEIKETPIISNPHIIHTINQLTEYFDHQRTKFDVALHPDGTPFQLQVWEMLKNIPYGETITYSDLAKKAGNPKAMRAVGKANGANKIPIIIPCHRVIGHNGSLTGFAGGIHRKLWLLNHERQTNPSELF